MIELLTKDELINALMHDAVRIKNINGTVLPVLPLHYSEFKEAAGITDHPDLKHYIRRANYDEKREIFKRAGCRVRHMSLSASVMLDYIDRDGLDIAYESGKSNSFIVEVSAGRQHLYFILDYKGPPLVRRLAVD